MRRRSVSKTVATAAIASAALALLAAPAQARSTAGHRSRPGIPASVGTPTAGTVPKVAINGVTAHLAKLQTFAEQNGGNRLAASAGYRASVAYVRSTLEAAGYTVTEQPCTSCQFRGNNLVADWPGGPADQVTMFGAHLDSVAAGPGINDNGSGSAALLENALVLARANPTMTRHVRFAWWNGEEQGMQGSRYYVSQLTSAQRSAIKGYYNFDMIGSVNGGYFINNITSSASAPMKAYWDSLGLQPEENREGAGRSDDYSFQSAGIPTSGYAMGASAQKTVAQASKWGGTANRAFDPCYHSACDTTANINTPMLDRAVEGIAYTIWKTSVSTDPVPGSDFDVSLTPATGSTAPGGSLTAVVATRTTSGSAQPVLLSASGAPAGVSASFSPWSVSTGASSTMTLTVGATVAAGSYPLTITGTGSVVRSARFTLVVDASTPGTDCTKELVGNGGFEDGSAPWVASSASIITNEAGQPPRSGSYKAWFNGYGRSTSHILAQPVTLPAGCSTALTFYLRVDSQEPGDSPARDTFSVAVNGTRVASYSNVSRTTGFAPQTVDLTPFAGTTVTLTFSGIEDAARATSFVMDDVSVTGR